MAEPLDHEACMRMALDLARQAGLHGDIPVGAVVIHQGKVIAMACNRREADQDPTAHAEILALRDAAKALGRRRLSDCILYVTLEPCPMCAGAMVMSSLGRCYFAARDERQGCAESIYALTQDPAFFHRLPCVGGLLEDEARELLRNFFEQKRTHKGEPS
ncbi:MAG: nucleoside deaminase [Clostridiales bacterium]|nr:nucleoside deaminase [Clostridiales bacterium]